MYKFSQPALFLAVILIAAPVGAEIRRTASGTPDLTGVYDTGTLTPTQRPEWLGETEYLYPWVASALNWVFGIASDWALTDESDPDREAPPAGGDGNNIGGAGGVGGYNLFYIDPGSSLGEIDGKVPTSIIYDPPNGRYPETRPGVADRFGTIYQSFAHENTGEATWLDHDGPGPFDGPESLAPSERCLISFGSTVPTISSLYNNYKRIVQTDTHVMILQEMVHDARIIRLDAQHSPESNRKWLGDSIGRWEGDTLVVETRGFRDISGLPGADENLQVVERFTPLEDGNLYYDFTVTDETVWTRPWSGRYVWQAKPDDLVYEYACHEGNYAMGNILRGARLLESEYPGGK
ncbi:MAG: hypothetical protein R3E82_15620 [Pseudomonadales bacterium]